MKRKFFFFDIDNTLISWPSGTLSDLTLGTVRALRQNGHLVAIATGRIQLDAIEYAKIAEIDNVVADGGYSVTINNKMLHMRPLDIEACRYLLRQLDVNQIPWAIVLDNKIERHTTHEHLTNRVAPWDYFKTIYNPNLNYEEINDIYKIFIYLTQDDEKKLAIDYGTLEHIRYGVDSILIEPMDKSVGIKLLADYYGIPYEDIVTFGDGNNDIRMFEPIWFNIAMGNANDRLKALADYVTDDCDKDGIYKACLHFGWINADEVYTG